MISINTLGPKQNGRHFADDTFNRIFVNENVIIPNKFSPKFVPKGPINNSPALVQIMAWRRSGYDKTTRTAICFEHKTQYILIRAPYTRIVVFWHISNIPPHDFAESN